MFQNSGAKFLVVYTSEGHRKEKWFDSEAEAAKFCKTVDGCVVKVPTKFKRRFK